MAILVDYKNVQLCQDGRPILSDVNLQVGEGEFVYVMGEVGSGKSSLMKSIYGELPIAKGQAIVLYTDVTHIKQRKLPVLRKQLGIIFQDFQLLRDRSVEDNLDFVLRATGWSSAKQRRARIAEVLEQVGLPEKADRMPHELSGGEQQCICIARALLNSPRLMLADEPTANLDADNSRKVMRLLNGIRRNGTTIILSTHNEAITDMFPGRMMRCQQGRLVEMKENEETE